MPVKWGRNPHIHVEEESLSDVRRSFQERVCVALAPHSLYDSLCTAAALSRTRTRHGVTCAQVNLVSLLIDNNDYHNIFVLSTNSSSNMTCLAIDMGQGFQQPPGRLHGGPYAFVAGAAEQVYLNARCPRCTTVSALKTFAASDDGALVQDLRARLHAAGVPLWQHLANLELYPSLELLVSQMQKRARRVLSIWNGTCDP